jgi:hypothetical protein
MAQRSLSPTVAIYGQRAGIDLEDSVEFRLNLGVHQHSAKYNRAVSESRILEIYTTSSPCDASQISVGGVENIPLSSRA